MSKSSFGSNGESEVRGKLIKVNLFGNQIKMCASTLMMPPPEMRVLEEEVGRRLSSITDVKRVGSNLMVSADGFDDHEFTRKARPSAASRDQVHWMN